MTVQIRNLAHWYEAILADETSPSFDDIWQWLARILDFPVEAHVHAMAKPVFDALMDYRRGVPGVTRYDVLVEMRKALDRDNASTQRQDTPTPPETESGAH